MANLKVNNILIPNVTKITPQQNIEKSKNTPSAPSEFQSLLDSTIDSMSNKEIQVSSHAMKRLQERNINLDKEEFQKLQSALDKLKTKGGQDSLVITGKGAYILDVGKNTIVTAMDKENLNENVFTKIDSTILMN